jgi:hypothetical protein
MAIDADVLRSEPVRRLCDMFASECVSHSLFREPSPDVPSMLNALGACAGFAAQAAVWRGLIVQKERNLGDFLALVTTKSKEVYFFGEPINIFLFYLMPDRFSFLSLAGATLSNSSELPDLPELAKHVASTIGSSAFGRPRLPASVTVSELPRTALARTWPKTARILKDCCPADWPALIGAAAQNIINANRQTVSPAIAIKILLESAVPMSKLDPRTVEESGVPAPVLTNWSTRASRPEDETQILNDVREVMPVPPPPKPRVIDRPTIAFLDLSDGMCESIIAEDKAQIGACFQDKAPLTTQQVPACDVLFLYCSLDSKRRVAGAGSSLRDLIAKSGASIAVVASEVPADVQKDPRFQKSVSRAGHPPVNLVITLDRRGAAFPRFFGELFQSMRDGLSMPMAWAKLAPQMPHQPPNLPGMIFLMEAGQVAFGKSA